MKRARRQDASENTTEILQSVAAACDGFDELSVSRFRFPASIPPDQLLFYHEVTIGLMWIEQTPGLLVVDTHTSFQSGTVLRGRTAEHP